MGWKKPLVGASLLLVASAFKPAAAINRNPTGAVASDHEVL
jgi:hypothetical protein